MGRVAKRVDGEDLEDRLAVGRLEEDEYEGLDSWVRRRRLEFEVDVDRRWLSALPSSKPLSERDMEVA
jgi:hypothetical protein